MLEFVAKTEVDIEKTRTVLERVGNDVFDGKSVLVFIAAFASALLVGKVLSGVLKRLALVVGKRADASTNLSTANRLRGVETWLTLSIALLRIALIALAVYFWWVYTHGGSDRTNSNAIIGASAVFVVLVGGVVGPLLRDYAFGVGMVVERWYGVGDLISIDFPNVQGVVERITLRSTRLRGLNGEVIWVANQTISGVRVAKKGVWPTAVELFVNDPDKAARLIGKVNNLLPGGLAMLVTPLRIVETIEREKGVWHVTAIGETAPGREWILERTALEVIKKLDADAAKPILIVDPVARYADSDSERQIARAVINARKKRRKLNYNRIGAMALPRRGSRDNDG